MRRTRRAKAKHNSSIIGAWKSKMKQKLQKQTDLTFSSRMGIQGSDDPAALEEFYRASPNKSVPDGDAAILPSGSQAANVYCEEYDQVEQKYTPTFEDQERFAESQPEHLNYSSVTTPFTSGNLKRDMECHETTNQSQSKRMRSSEVEYESPPPEEEDEESEDRNCAVKVRVSHRSGEKELMPKKDEDIEWARLDLERKKLELEERRVAIEERRIRIEESRQNVECTHWIRMEKLIEEVIKGVKDSASKVNDSIAQLIFQMRADRQPKNVPIPATCQNSYTHLN